MVSGAKKTVPALMERALPHNLDAERIKPFRTRLRANESSHVVSVIGQPFDEGTTDETRGARNENVHVLRSVMTDPRW